MIYWRVTYEQLWRPISNNLWPLDWKTSERYSLCKKVVINTFLGFIMPTLHYIWAVYFWIQIGREFWGERLCEVLKHESSFTSSLGICSSFVKKKAIKSVCHRSLKVFSRNSVESKFSISQDCFNIWQEKDAWSVKGN